MKNFTLLLLLLSFFSLQLSAQADKSLVKSIDLNGNISVAALLNGQTTVTEWDKDFIRITTHINLTNSNASILERLISVGRYEITMSEQDGEMILSMPKAAIGIVLKGTSLIEEYSFEITIPKEVSFRVETPSEGI